MGEKRKNDRPRRIRWWLLVAAFAFGVLLTLIATQGRGQIVTVDSAPPNNLWLTATAIVQEATAVARSAGLSEQADPIFATATAMMIQATANAGQSGG